MTTVTSSQKRNDDENSTPKPPVSRPEEASSETKEAAVSKFDWMAALKVAGGLIAAVAALLTALNGADWLRPADPLASTTVEPLPTATVVEVTESSTTLAATETEPKSTSVSTAVSSPTEVSILIDDFSDSSSGWELASDSEYELKYDDGQYLVSVHVPDTSAWGSPASTYVFSDFVMEAESRQVAGPDDADFGLVLRNRQGSDFYYFAVSSSQRMYSVQRSQGDNWVELVEWTDSEAVAGGDAVNLLRAECIGSTLRFYVNGQFLVEVSDDTYAEGAVGLMAETFDAGGTIVGFDNVRVQVLKRFGR